MSLEKVRKDPVKTTLAETTGIIDPFLGGSTKLRKWKPELCRCRESGKFMKILVGFRIWGLHELHETDSQPKAGLRSHIIQKQLVHRTNSQRRKSMNYVGPEIGKSMTGPAWGKHQHHRVRFGIANLPGCPSIPNNSEPRQCSQSQRHCTDCMLSCQVPSWVHVQNRLTLFFFFFLNQFQKAAKSTDLLFNLQSLS